jgi:hypothetical protein
LGICTTMTHGHDVWRRVGGLGPIAERLWDSWQRFGPQTIIELAKRLGPYPSKRSIERAVKCMSRLEDHVSGEIMRMVQKQPDGRDAPLPDVDLDAVADFLHVKGAGAAQVARYEREREQHVTNARGEKGKSGRDAGNRARTGKNGRDCCGAGGVSARAYILLAGIRAVLVALATIRYVRVHPFPRSGETYG